MKKNKCCFEHGFSLLELLIVIALSSIMMGFAYLNTNEARDDLNYSADLVVSLLKKARSKSISTTRAYTIYPTSNSRIASKYSDKCTDTSFQNDPSMLLVLPRGVLLANTTWSLCISPRGIAKSSVDILILEGSRNKTVQVALGGAVRVQ
jgi:prepilin-type N-terminal cleavage/methylation domain-containing protein